MGLSRRGVTAGIAASALAPRLSRAQAAWPSQIVRFVVPFTPGGSTDLLARILARKLEPAIGQPIITENRPGAGGAVAASAVAKSDPDGHTFMMGHIGTLAFNPSLYANLSYDPAKDFAPVALVARLPNILVINPSISATDVRAFIAHAKDNPGKLNFGSGGNGSAAHIAAAYFAHAAGVKVTHVPYRGTSPSVSDLVAGHIQFTLTGGPAVLPLVADGKLRALAVSSRARAPFAPDLPTINEAAIPGFEATQWYGLVAPARTPAAIVDRMNREINALLDSADVADNLRNDGAIAAPTTPAGFGALIASEIALWRDVIRQAGITAG